MWSSAFGDGDPDLERRMSRPENELPTGVAFQLAARARGPEDPAAGDRLGELFWDYRGGSPRFLFGVQFADGRRASNAVGGGGDGDLLFHPGGGSGGSSSVDQEWWLSPLAPEGPLLVVVRCPEIGLEETVTELDGTAIRRAERRRPSRGPGSRPWSRPTSRRLRLTCPPAAGSPADPTGWFRR